MLVEGEVTAEREVADGLRGKEVVLTISDDVGVGGGLLAAIGS